LAREDSGESSCDFRFFEARTSQHQVTTGSECTLF
jgi:hypothetical protein